VTRGGEGGKSACHEKGRERHSLCFGVRGGWAEGKEAPDKAEEMGSD